MRRTKPKQTDKPARQPLERENVRFPADWGDAIDQFRGDKSRSEFILDQLQLRLIELGAAELSRRPGRGRPKAQPDGQP